MLTCYVRIFFLVTFVTTMVILASLLIGWYVTLSHHVNCLAIYILALTFLPKTCFLVYSCSLIPLSILHATLVSSLATVIFFFFLGLNIFHTALLSSSFDLLQVSIGSKDSRLVVELFKLLSLISNVFLILFFFFFEKPSSFIKSCNTHLQFSTHIVEAQGGCCDGGDPYG